MDIPEDSTIENTLTNMPKTTKEPARRLMNLLASQRGPLTWTPNGEVFIDNHKMHGTHISDLVHDVIRQSKTVNPNRQRFLKVLASMNVPDNLIRNVDADKCSNK